MIRAALALMAMSLPAAVQAQIAPVPPPVVVPSPAIDAPIFSIGPIGSWELERGTAGACAVSRNYGSAERPVTVTILSAADEQRLTIYVVTGAEATGPGIGGGTGALILTPGTRTTAEYSSFDVLGRGQHFGVLYLERTALDGLAAAQTLAIKTDATTTIAAADMKAAIDATDTCQAKLYASWGVDPKRFGYGKPKPTPLGGNPGSWFMGDDYPAAALRDNRQGRVVILIDVGANGTITGCRVIESAGSADLDETSCRLATERGRFTPAKDAQGKSVASWAIVPVRWSLQQTNAN